jgi:hypothetical protein
MIQILPEMAVQKAIAEILFAIATYLGECQMIKFKKKVKKRSLIDLVVKQF